MSQDAFAKGFSQNKIPGNVGWVERSATHRLPVRIFVSGYIGVLFI